MNKHNIKEMDLYKSTNRFIKNYNFLKDKLKRQPTIEELSDFDHLHYNGISTVEKAISKTNINDKSVVLDIGSGIGGPARYIASKTKAKIYAVEIQSELNNIGLALTNDYKLEKYIKHLKADILEYDFSEKYFDNIVSWLALYHISERPKLLKKLYYLLKKDGYFYTEDFFLNSSIKEKDKKILSQSFHANHLVEYEIYLKELKDSGFKILEATDLSKDWKQFTKNRFFDYKKNIKKYLEIHDATTVKNVLKFYELAYKLLLEKKIGGIRYICSKKS